MAEEIDIAGYTDEELIRKYSVISDGHRYIKASVLDAIGKRQAQQANRKPGDPGTKENPIFREKHAFIYNSRNRLVLWEDYEGIIPDEDNVVFHINPDIMEVFKLTHDMQPSEEQKKLSKWRQNRRKSSRRTALILRRNSWKGSADSGRCAID